MALRNGLHGWPNVCARHSEPLLRLGSQHTVFSVPLALVGVLLGLACAFPASAFADEQDDVHADLVAVRTQIKDDLQAAKELEVQIGSTRERIDQIDAKMQDTLETISTMQDKYARLQGNASQTAVQLYKERLAYNPLFILQDAESLTDAIWRLDMRDRILQQYGKDLESTKKYSKKLKAVYRKISREKDEQNALVDDLREQGRELSKRIADLKAREKDLQASEKAALAQAAAAASEVAKTFDTGTLESDSEWHVGLASAYGGDSDDMTPKDELTATGTVCDDWSVGVAVPLAWGPSKYYGRSVEISYNGQSIIAPVVDCGDMDSGRRALDLQPGVFKAFGCTTCDDWGVREVYYRFL